MSILDQVLNNASSLEADVALLSKAITLDVSVLHSVISTLAESQYLQELAPLLINDLSVGIANSSLDPEEIIDVFSSFTRYCRLTELHSLALDSWINLWSASSNDFPNIDRARLCTGYLIVECIVKAVKGPLYKCKEDYMLTFAGQLLNKYWNKQPTGIDCQPWRDLTNKVISAFSLWKSGDSARNLANYEICIRLIAAQPEAEIGTIFQNEDLLSFVTTRIESLSAKASFERTGDFEVTDFDFALIVLGSVLRPERVPLVPRIWRFEKQVTVYMSTLEILVMNQFDIFAITRLLTWVLTEAKHFEFVLSADRVGEIFRKVVEAATSMGSESDMSLEDRRNVYTLIARVLKVPEYKSKAISICLEVVKSSRIDACVGIFVKLAKDIDPENETLFFQISDSAWSDSRIVDSVDSLKSVLNWARLVFMKGQPVAPKEKISNFRNTVLGLSSRIDVELGEYAPDSAEHVRILFVAHLLSRVKELLSQ